MKRFDYVKVKSLSEATELLTRHGEKAHILAGGTDVLVKLKQGEIAPEILVDIKGIRGLEGIQFRPGEGMRIGPLTTIREIETSPIIREHLPVLAHAAHMLGSVQVRHRATIGGNLCNALPSADTGPYLIAMGARATVVGLSGERKMLVEDLFAASGKNSLAPGEIVIEIEIPAWSPFTGGAYIKHAIKNAVDVAIVCVAAVVVTDPRKEVFEEGRIALGAVGPRPIRPREAEESLRGKRIDEGVIATVGELASRDARPRTTVEYKTEMVEVLTKRAIRQAVADLRARIVDSRSPGSTS
jgi:carbon-monoxide dehydrogenase medium subunit